MALWQSEIGGGGQLTDSVVGTLKAHRTTGDTNVTADAWTDTSSLTVIADETQGSVAELNADGKTIDILEDGLYKFGGCVHCQNNTAGLFTGIVVLSRILQNKGEASEAELRCSQRGYDINIAAGGEDVLSYNGTAALQAGDTLNLQYYTDNSDLEFNSNAAFDNQVAYTIWLTRDGDLES